MKTNLDKEYEIKYINYKQKYINLKNSIGGKKKKKKINIEEIKKYNEEKIKEVKIYYNKIINLMNKNNFQNDKKYIIDLLISIKKPLNDILSKADIYNSLEENYYDQMLNYIQHEFNKMDDEMLKNIIKNDLISILEAIPLKLQTQQTKNMSNNPQSLSLFKVLVEKKEREKEREKDREKEREKIIKKKNRCNIM